MLLNVVVTVSRTETMQKCVDVTQGYQTKAECEEWPVQRCSLERVKVTKYTPETSCQAEPRELCAPVGCGVTNVSGEHSDDDRLMPSVCAGRADVP